MFALKSARTGPEDGRWNSKTWNRKVGTWGQPRRGLGWLCFLMMASGFHGGFAAVEAGTPSLERTARACHDRGLVAIRQGDWDTALDLMRAALELDPDFLPPLFWIGRIAFELEEWDAAEAAFRQVLAEKPSSRETWYWLGRTLDALERGRDARDAYLASLRLALPAEEARDALVRLPRLMSWAGLSPAARAQRLLARLRGQQPVTVVALGDSLVSGFELAEPQRDGYVYVFARLLRQRFQNGQVRLIERGIPGEQSGQGLQRVWRDVIQDDPDLVLVQYGGNDSAAGVPPEAYRRNLEGMAEDLLCQTKAAVIVATPPMDEAEPDSPFVIAARQAAAAMGLGVADLDTALREGGRDYRGAFPLGLHPQPFGHRLMAEEVERAFERLTGLPQEISFEVDGPWQAVALNEPAKRRVRLRNHRPQPSQGSLTVRLGPERQRIPFRLEGRAEAEIPVPLSLPPELPAGRAWSQRLHLAARSGTAWFGQQRWLTLAPLLQATPLTARPTLKDGQWPEGLPRQGLTETHLTAGQTAWAGPADLSAAFGVGQDENAVYLLLEVRDDQLCPPASPAQPSGDRLELYFDLRPAELRGKPHYTPQVLRLEVTLPAKPDAPPALQISPEKTGGREQISLDYQPTEKGYDLQVALSRSFLQEVAGGPVPSFGFDLSLCDVDRSEESDRSDRSDRSDKQMTWAGQADNPINPRRWGEVVLAGTFPADAVKMTVW